MRSLQKDCSDPTASQPNEADQTVSHEAMLDTRIWRREVRGNSGESLLYQYLQPSLHYRFQKDARLRINQLAKDLAAAEMGAKTFQRRMLEHKDVKAAYEEDGGITTSRTF